MLLLFRAQRKNESKVSDSDTESSDGVDDLFSERPNISVICFSSLLFRAQRKNEGDVSDSDTESSDGVDDLFSERPNIPLMNSTMISSASMISSSDPMAMDKINALEDELSTLRSQIALLVLNQDSNRSQCMYFIEKSNDLTAV